MHNRADGLRLVKFCILKPNSMIKWAGLGAYHHNWSKLITIQPRSNGGHGTFIK